MDEAERRSRLALKTPAQIDTKLVEIKGKLQRANQDLKAATRTKSAGAVEDARAEVFRYQRQAQILEVEYDRRPWTRFYLVANTNGHIHSTMVCTTTYPTTPWGWLPHLSGLTEEDAVKAEGPKLCSVCYPSAPAEWTVGSDGLRPEHCLGSDGDYAEGTFKDRRRYYGQGVYGDCPECGAEGLRLKSGNKLPRHKPAAKAGTAQKTPASQPGHGEYVAASDLKEGVTEFWHDGVRWLARRVTEIPGLDLWHVNALSLTGEKTSHEFRVSGKATPFFVASGAARTVPEESEGTRAVLLELQREYAIGETVGERLAVTGSPADFRQRAEKWLKGQSELSGRIIKAADWPSIFSYFRGTVT